MGRSVRIRSCPARTFDWVVERAEQAWPGPSYVTDVRERFAQVPAARSANPTRADAEQALAWFATTVRPRWSRLAVLEWSASEPLLTDYHARQRTGHYSALLPTGTDARRWAARHPNYNFYSGDLLSFSRSFHETFNFVAGLTRLDPWMIAPLARLLRRGGYMLLQPTIPPGTSANCLRFDTILQRHGMTICARLTLDASTCFILTVRR